ncbi:MAG: hypothetical protein OSA99_18885 [Acidimicrobiales bacterium]|nr:hypothetical protein [Acidimicrobiales bacterium]
MIDYGLVVSMMAAIGIPSLAALRWSLSTAESEYGIVDLAIGPVLAGVVVGRLTTLAFDDPGSIGSLSDMLVVRSGVEFWPGVAAAAGVVAFSARRDGVSPADRMRALAPFAMLGYASYEAACVFRDGCLGPVAALGLRPPGLEVTMVPVGWLMALVVTAGAVGVRRLASTGIPTSAVLATAIAVTASARSVGSIWLPHVGDGLTRQHLTSVIVAGCSIAWLAVAVVRADDVDDDTRDRGISGWPQT